MTVGSKFDFGGGIWRTHEDVYSKALARDKSKDPISCCIEKMQQSSKEVSEYSRTFLNMVRLEIFTRMPVFDGTTDGCVNPYDEIAEKIRQEYIKEAESFCQRLLQYYPSGEKLIQAYQSKMLELNAFADRCREFEQMGLEAGAKAVAVIQEAIRRQNERQKLLETLKRSLPWIAILVFFIYALIVSAFRR